MIEQIVEFAAPWFGVTDAGAIQIATGVLLAGMIGLVVGAVIWAIVTLVAAFR